MRVTASAMNEAQSGGISGSCADAIHIKHDPAGRGSGNSRNGMTRETLLSDIGGLHLEVPRDRNGSFEPRIVRKGQTRLDGFNERIIALYARAGCRCAIRTHLREIYDVDVSPNLTAAD